MPDITVIIVNWNVRELLRSCLTSVMAQHNVNAEVIVVDNASHDGSVAMVRQEFPSIQVIANDRNLGFATANNQGIRQAHGRCLLLLNPDTDVPDGALAKTIRYFDEHPDVGIVGARLTNSDGSLQRSVRRDPTFAALALVLCKFQAFFPNLGPLRRYWYADFDYTQEQDVSQVMGAFFAINGEVPKKVGLLDEAFFLWFEEVDYCARVRRAGFRVRYVPTISITHRGGESFRQLFNLRQQIIFNASLLTYVKKHQPWRSWAALAVLTPVSLLFAIGEPLIRPLYAPKTLR
ncbi:MAG: glycosyltransferase family 2 protein [Candidatus Kerfeldbacteria bacterium]|nr:glycosyltransferase family 2 protein [Candidatus Kerfeldbacteria bacterium]